jgi:hypothetical protein
MSFWLHESFFITFLRGLTRQARVLVTLGCAVIAVAGSWLRKQQLAAPQIVQEHELRAGLDRQKYVKPSRKIKPVRVALNTQALPQTLHFFSDAGFYVCNVEQLLAPRSKQLIGYAVRLHGSFETLLKFLTTLKQSPAAHILSLQSIERIDDTKLVIDFLIKGGR